MGINKGIWRRLQAMERIVTPRMQPTPRERCFQRIRDAEDRIWFRAVDELGDLLGEERSLDLCRYTRELGLTYLPRPAATYEPLTDQERAEVERKLADVDTHRVQMLDERLYCRWVNFCGGNTLGELGEAKAAREREFMSSVQSWGRVEPWEEEAIREVIARVLRVYAHDPDYTPPATSMYVNEPYLWTQVAGGWFVNPTPGMTEAADSTMAYLLGETGWSEVRDSNEEAIRELWGYM